jgi:hypothetical protein
VLPGDGELRTGRASRDGDPCRRLSLRWGDHNLNVLPERGQSLHQPFERDARNLVVPNRRNFRLRDVQQLGRGSLGERPSFENVVDLFGENHLGREFFRIRKTKIDQHIVDTAMSMGASHGQFPLSR